MGCGLFWATLRRSGCWSAICLMYEAIQSDVPAALLNTQINVDAISIRSMVLLWRSSVVALLMFPPRDRCRALMVWSASFASLRAASGESSRSVSETHAPDFNLSRQVHHHNLPPSTHHERCQHVLPLRLLGSSYHLQPNSASVPLTLPLSGRIPNPPPARHPQPSSVASLRRSPKVLPVHRSALGDRQGRRICSRRSVHEGHARDTAVRILARRDSDSRSAGRQPAEVHCVQRVGG